MARKIELMDDVVKAIDTAYGELRIAYSATQQIETKEDTKDYLEYVRQACDSIEKARHILESQKWGYLNLEVE